MIGHEKKKHGNPTDATTEGNTTSQWKQLGQLRGPELQKTVWTIDLK